MLALRGARRHLRVPAQLESRIAALEAEVAALRSCGPASVAATATVPAAVPLAPSPGPVSAPTSAPPPPPPSVTTQPPDHAALSVAAPAAPDDEHVLVGEFDGLKLDDRGLPTYHGATSFFHLLSSSRLSLPATAPGSISEAPPFFSCDSNTAPSSEGPLGHEKRQRLVLNAWHQRELETMSQVPEPFQDLLDIHWCWIQPLFNFIYRPAFTRDMAVLGPYYSHTLMNALLSHSVRWARSSSRTREMLEPYDNGAVFARHARDMIFAELRQGGCTIPTVQTLLLLSAQECSLGHCAQAWVYSGIAFRLLDHLGICFDGQPRHAGSVTLSDEDMEIRRRLFWSCYFWDKVISIYLGRSPSLRESLVSPPQHMLDDSAEEELWQPHGISFPPGEEYPPTKAHSTSSFVQMCRLAVIFNQILTHMYDPLQHSTSAQVRQCVLEQEAALNQWWAELPVFLKIDVHSLPLLCPPSHIVTLNCLYHVFRILMYRPMLSHAPDLSHLLACVASATAIVCIYDLFCRTFHDAPCVLSLNYSVYIAASVFLLQVQALASNEHAIRCLEFCIRALQRARLVNPIISSALSLITTATDELGIDTANLAPLIYSGPADTTPAAAATQGQPDPGPTSFMPGPFPLFSEDGMDTVLPAFHFDGLDHLEISQEMFEAVSALEPIPAQVGSIMDASIASLGDNSPVL
ncbi:hypothetical protein SCUCBS95973_001534 [Sporothrix curviconia]|uniref:Xylanolytic transcriptional activator regulatory domain-containing protein n=1 Tax=Sporothrix curviconia TaxID=1260050 RepID=A0ABP0AZZ9_9PEZI